MDILRYILLFVHFVGFATLFAGALMTLKQQGKGLATATLHGAITQLVTGLGLVTLLELHPDDPTVNHAKVGTKLALLIVTTVLVVVFRKKELPTWVVPTILGLTVLTAAVAVFWR